MPVLVDTNIIIDVLTDDKLWAEWSVSQLKKFSDQGLWINPVIYSELCYGSPSTDFVDDVIKNFGLKYQEIPRAGLFRAAQAFKKYKSREGQKTSCLPDFFIGAHAEALGITLLTRDTKRLKKYFPGVEMIHPKTA